MEEERTADVIVKLEVKSNTASSSSLSDDHWIDCAGLPTVAPSADSMNATTTTNIHSSQPQKNAVCAFYERTFAVADRVGGQSRSSFDMQLERSRVSPLGRAAKRGDGVLGALHESQHRACVVLFLLLLLFVCARNFWFTLRTSQLKTLS